MAVLERDLAALDRLVHSQLLGHEREHVLLMQGVEEFKAFLKTKLLEMNEVRAQINAERGNYAAQTTVDAKVDATRAQMSSLDSALQARVKSLEMVMSNYQGRLWALGGGLTALTIIIKIFWK